MTRLPGFIADNHSRQNVQCFESKTPLFRVERRTRGTKYEGHLCDKQNVFGGFIVVAEIDGSGSVANCVLDVLVRDGEAGWERGNRVLSVQGELKHQVFGPNCTLLS